MNPELISIFKRLYDEFKLTNDYAERKRQFQIVGVCKSIIKETLNNNSLTNEHLTGLIQLLKHGTTKSTFERYLQINIHDPVRRRDIDERFSKLNQQGYTAAGLQSIGDLNQAQLDTVQKFLNDAFVVKDIDEAKRLCIAYDQHAIPLVTSGIYSPWLYYINPYLFPILNRSHTPFREWIGLPVDYPTCLVAFNQLKDEVRERDLGLIDRFTHEFKKYMENSSSLKVLDLNGKRFFKISHGIFRKNKKYRDNGVDKIFEDNNWICMSKFTGAGQGHRFVEYAEIGDYVYVCYGGDNLLCVARIISDSAQLDDATSELIDDSEDWVYRRIEPLFYPEESGLSELKSERKGFMPSGNSTFIEVPDDQLEFLSEKIFIPKCKLRIIDDGGEVPEDDTVDEDEDFVELPALNTILYGPPGTGKTYELLNIIKRLKLIKRLREPQPDYDLFVQDFTWWEILVITFFDMKRASVPELLRYPLIQAKLRAVNIQNPRARLWSVLQHQTVEHCESVKLKKRHGEPLFFKEKNSVWRLDNESQVIEDFPALNESWIALKDQNFQTDEIKNYTFTTCHQNLSYEDFIEGIKPVLAKDTDLEDTADTVQYTIKKGLFYLACNKAAQLAGYENLTSSLQDSKVARAEKFAVALAQNKIYVLFLDEINRCNVSAVFGELITLIEDDKRLGSENEIVDVLLPYSQTLFGVPGNLFIIGTMNTADRSVEALDTALRRRFVFDHKLPLPERLTAISEGIDLSAMLTAINTRLEILLDKDHTIGHAWLWNIKDLAGLKAAFKNKILPLLQEYFYNNTEKIGLVLGDAFVTGKQVDAKTFAIFQNGIAAGDYLEELIYTLKLADQLTISDFRSIYQLS